MKEIVLASASPRRIALLNNIGFKFKISPSNIDEHINPELSPEKAVEDLSYQKALTVAKMIKKDSIIIGADTIVFKHKILGKPKDEQDAFNMLKTLQGEWHEVITGITVIDSITLNSIIKHEKTMVKMCKLNDQDINAYIKTGECMDKAGAYGIQGRGSILVERIEGCYFNVVGLSLVRLNDMLKNFDISLI